MADSFSDSLKKFSKKVEAAINPGTIPMGELFPPAFMVRNTRTANIDAFFQAGKFDIAQQSDLEALPASELDAHVRAHSKYQSWNDMKIAAYEEWAARKMR